VSTINHYSDCVHRMILADKLTTDQTHWQKIRESIGIVSIRLLITKTTLLHEIQSSLHFNSRTAVVDLNDVGPASAVDCFPRCARSR
jgi:hypothetical protein